MHQNPISDITINQRRYPGAGVRLLELHADFECGCCGMCCRNGWQVRVFPEEYERMAQRLREAGWPAEKVKRCFETVRADDGKTVVCIGTTESGECAFLESGEGGATACALQRQFGHEVLGSVCQSFPRLAIVTPAGVRLTLSYTCPAAARTLLARGGLRETFPRKVMKWHPALQGTAVLGDAKAPKLSGNIHPEWAAFDYFWRWTADWMSTPDLTPAQGLWGLGTFVNLIEKNAQSVQKLNLMVEGLDRVQPEVAKSVKEFAPEMPPQTELGTVYFDTLLAILRQISSLTGIWERAWERLREGGERRLEALSEPYDQIIRPRAAEFESIERNYLASRLYANPYVYRAASLRMGYFIGLMHFVALRFSALMIHLEEGGALDETVWLRAAGLADGILQHNDMTQMQFFRQIEPLLAGPILSLSSVALF